MEAVMGAYNRTNGEPCCANTELMKELREDRGFKGHFVSDCRAVRDFHEGHKVTSRPKEFVTMALKADCNVNCSRWRDNYGKNRRFRGSPEGDRRKRQSG